MGNFNTKYTINFEEDQYSTIRTASSLATRETLSWGQLFGFIMSFLGLGLVSGLMINIIGIALNREEQFLLIGFYGLIIEAIMFVIALLLFKNVRQFSFQKLNFSSLKSGMTYLYITVSFVLLFISQLIFIGLLQMDDASKQYETFGGNLISNHWYSFALFYFALAIITPIKEELLFRGLILRFFEVKYNYWVGFTISSIIFGSLHFDYPLSAIMMGAILAGLYKITDSIVPPILLHVLWNIFAVFTII